MALTRMRTVYVSADDVDACAQFYSSILEAPVRFRDGARWVQFVTPDVGFAVASRPEAPSGVLVPVIVFEASEAADHARVLEAGGAFIEERDMGTHGRTTTYRDPAGNIFQLYWRA